MYLSSIDGEDGVTTTYDEGTDNLRWQYSEETGLVKNIKNGQCMALNSNDEKVKMVSCDQNDEDQQWCFGGAGAVRGRVGS